MNSVSNIVWHILNTKKFVIIYMKLSLPITPEGGVCTKEAKKTF